MTTTAIVPIQPDEYAMFERMAGTLVQSGFLPSSVNNAQKAIAIVLCGRELGIAPWQALSTINVIQGKPTISPQLMLALIQRSGQLENIVYESTNTACTVTMKRYGQAPHSETFTKEDAVAQDLWGKSNWKKQPKVMLRWRAVAACARIVFPDVILGLYTPEEMGADVDVTDDGAMHISTPPTPHEPDDTIIEGTSEDVPPAPSHPFGKPHPKRTTRDIDAIYEATKTHWNHIAHLKNALEKLRHEGTITDAMTDEQVIAAINANREAEGKSNAAWFNDTETVKALNAAFKERGTTLDAMLKRMGQKLTDYASADALLASALDVIRNDEALEGALNN